MQLEHCIGATKCGERGTLSYSIILTLMPPQRVPDIGVEDSAKVSLHVKPCRAPFGAALGGRRRSATTIKGVVDGLFAAEARKRFPALVGWLERSGNDETAASLREGSKETLTVLKLELPASLRRSLTTTNAIENLMGSIRRVSRNVKRWKNPNTIRRWSVLGIVTARKRFRRINGYREMSACFSKQSGFC